MIKQFSDLTPEQVQKICEAFAKMDPYIEATEVRYYKFGKCKVRGKRVGTFTGMPRYAESLDDMHRIIVGMEDAELFDYSDRLIDVMGYEFQYSQHIHKATAQQQFVAAAMALGLIKEGEK